MRNGLKEDTLEQIINVFARIPKIEEVIIFGSRAMGTHRKGSDIDLALKGKDINLDDLLKISTELDELELPYLFDLLVFDRIENRDLKNHIYRVGETIYHR
jgi:predicted nucleotidyltransferase